MSSPATCLVWGGACRPQIADCSYPSCRGWRGRAVAYLRFVASPLQHSYQVLHSLAMSAHLLDPLQPGVRILRLESAPSHCLCSRSGWAASACCGLWQWLVGKQLPAPSASVRPRISIDAYRVAPRILPKNARKTVVRGNWGARSNCYIESSSQQLGRAASWKVENGQQSW